MLTLAFLMQLAATSTPPSGDTVGYWQQRVHYRIAATLDEPTATLHASGTLVYVNNSPDTLREFYVHQYLNAFRPHSKWSESDAGEGRVRFQNLKDPDFGFERFTAPTSVRFSDSGEWVALAPVYPGAPDSTVVRFALPRGLVPRDSMTVRFAWDARVSTVPRRQGRRGRHYDFAQWFPKVAVYDRGGWQHNPLIPAGEFYGEFGTYDVTLTVRDDQVIGSTGVPVSGDPGWERVKRWGAVFPAARPAAADDTVSAVATPRGFKSVRWVAESVHHFGWSVSPDYMFEGAAYIRKDSTREASSVPVFDTVPIYVLYRPGDEKEWGNGAVVRRVGDALGWLEFLYGPYAYPQLTSLHRLDGGGTEFPMLMMNGSPSLGLNLHEGGHMYSYAILANNEWRSAWMDEGLSDYQTEWAQGLTPKERAKRPAPVAAPVKGYRRHAILPWSFEGSDIEEHRLQLTGQAQPLATPATRAREFRVYSQLAYTRAGTMYGALHDVMGDSTFIQFLRGYYSRWALRHVDELAMRTEAERAYGKPLGWFFDQWLHRTGVTDYSLEDVRTRRDGSEWVTTASVVKRGDFLHPVPLGVRTPDGWTTARGDPLLAKQKLEVRTSAKPTEIRLDPYRVTDDWDRRNDVVSRGLFGHDARRVIFAWPFLDHVDRERSVMTVRPEGWLGKDRLTLGARLRSSYQGWIDKYDVGLAASPRPPGLRRQFSGDVARPPESVFERLGPQGWVVAENFRAGESKPKTGTRAGIWVLDGVAKLDIRRRFNDNAFVFAQGRTGHRTVALTGTVVYDNTFADPRRWSSEAVLDLSAEYVTTLSARRDVTVRALFDVGLMTLPGPGPSGGDRKLFSRTELEGRRKKVTGTAGNRMHTQRAFFAFSDAPVERATMLSSANPTESFEEHFTRPRGGPLAPPEYGGSAPPWSYLIPGGAYLRGYSAALPIGKAVAANVEESYRFRSFGGSARRVHLWGSVFADAAVSIAGGTRRITDRILADAGVGLALRGRLYDRDVTLRADFPIYVRALNASADELGFRLRVSSRDLF